MLKYWLVWVLGASVVWIGVDRFCLCVVGWFEFVVWICGLGLVLETRLGCCVVWLVVLLWFKFLALGCVVGLMAACLVLVVWWVV